MYFMILSSIFVALFVFHSVPFFVFLLVLFFSCAYVRYVFFSIKDRMFQKCNIKIDWKQKNLTVAIRSRVSCAHNIYVDAMPIVTT